MTKKLREMDPYDPDIDGNFLYRAMQLAALLGVGAAVWFIHTYVGWGNLLILFVGLLVLGGLIDWWYSRTFTETRFGGLDHRGHDDEVYAYEYALTAEELTEIEVLEKILGLPEAATSSTVSTAENDSMARILYVLLVGSLWVVSIPWLLFSKGADERDRTDILLIHVCTILVGVAIASAGGVVGGILYYLAGAAITGFSYLYFRTEG